MRFDPASLRSAMTAIIDRHVELADRWRNLRALLVGSEPWAMQRSVFLNVRLTPEEREELQLLADADHLNLSTWARMILLKEAEKK